MLSAARIELEQLLARIRSVQPKSVSDVRGEVEKYFNHEIGWSLLKNEWDQMSADERETFVRNVFEDVK